MRYQIEKHTNGSYLVLDNSIVGFQVVAAGMTQAQAQKWADRLNLRASWGI